MLFTKLPEGLSAPLASLYTVFFGGKSIIRLLSYRHKALRYLLGRGTLSRAIFAHSTSRARATQSALWSG